MKKQKSVSRIVGTMLLMLVAIPNSFAQKIVRYDLYVRDTIVNYSGKEKRAIAVNGQIPMPTLTSGQNAST